MMDVKIYKPSKNVMQSGKAKTNFWVLEYELETARRPEPLMGWTSSGDTLGQVRLKFPTKQDAEAFAQDKGWSFTTLPEHQRIVKPRNYTDNFKYIPPDTQESA